MEEITNNSNKYYLLGLFVISSSNQVMYKLLFILFIIELYARINIFITRLGFKQNDAILIKKQSMLTKIMSSLEGENMQYIIILVLGLTCIFMTKSLQKKLMKKETEKNFDYKIKR